MHKRGLSQKENIPDNGSVAHGNGGYSGGYNTGYNRDYNRDYYGGYSGTPKSFVPACLQAASSNVPPSVTVSKSRPDTQMLAAYDKVLSELQQYCAMHKETRQLQSEIKQLKIRREYLKKELKDI